MRKFTEGGSTKQIFGEIIDGGDRVKLVGYLANGIELHKLQLFPVDVEFGEERRDWILQHQGKQALAIVELVEKNLTRLTLWVYSEKNIIETGISFPIKPDLLDGLQVED